MHFCLKICAKDIGYMQNCDGKDLANMACKPLDVYQGKFTIEVSSRDAFRSSSVELMFTGGEPQNLCTEVQLHFSTAFSEH